MSLETNLWVSAAKPTPSGRRFPIALVITSVIAWGLVLLGPDGMGVGMFAFLAAWTVMMVAMMLPTALPFVLLYSRGARPWQAGLLTVGYLAVWALAGVPAFIGHETMSMMVGPAALAVAGIYQLTPLKAACLSKCRSPADFLIQRWGRGAFRLGAEHGFWCLGCCWALMGILVLVGGMGLPWVIGLSLIVAFEKQSRHGLVLSRATGILFLLGAIFQGVRLWNGEPMEMS